MILASRAHVLRKLFQRGFLLAVLSLPTLAQAERPSPVRVKWTSGVMQDACAPHDAVSMQILVTDGKKDFPVLTINWWGEGKPSLQGGTFTASVKADSFENGIDARYCPKRGRCKGLKSIDLNLIWKKEAVRGILNFTVLTQDDEAFSGSVPVTFRPGNALCG